jgi:hypothetical protein
METAESAARTRAANIPPMITGCGIGSVAPTMTALASPRLIASMPSLRQSPKVAQAPMGAKLRPCTWASIDSCEAGVLWMFQMTLGETDRHGGSGLPTCPAA